MANCVKLSSLSYVICQKLLTFDLIIMIMIMIMIMIIIIIMIMIIIIIRSAAR